ncbi:hypothetical protein OH76DRAFT_1401000 [Lentinus brumalis]|uniref:Uncharacterized protein n=1 Tax=Lentinus brumalis TaxID=2498619 RepID=A0A371DHU0_9APHY|nr:hypothetical protein OH76DRAFT_1401000 [Polyporus brumalis]
MHSALAYHHPPAPSPAHHPMAAHTAVMMPPRPHLEVYTGHDMPSAVPIATPQEEYFVRDMFTPSPTSSTFYTETPLPHYSQEAFMLPPYSPASSSPSTAGSSSVAPSRRDARRLSEPACLAEGLVVKGPITHPYARLYSKKHSAGKRRKMWNHTLEKLVFTPQEIATMGAPHRRTIYLASLEAHIDRLHEQLLGYSLAPVPFEQLEPYRGLNAKTAKSMVSGLQHDAGEIKLKILELERANKTLEQTLGHH